MPLILRLAALALALTVTAAQAEKFTPCSAGATISVTTGSSRAQVPACANAVIIYNTGSVEAFYKQGTSSVTAATTDFSLPGLTYVVIDITSGQYIAAITASSSTTIRLVPGQKF